MQYKNLLRFFKTVYRRNFGSGMVYVRGLFLIFGLDALITDDEPLWEPIEWSLVQTWILYIFFFAWIAENLITSRYGSYTGRDKRVWLAWYKSFWLIEAWFALSFGAAAMFVIVPFYYEITYQIAFIATWWDWYTRTFFFKFIGLYSITIIASHYLLINIRRGNVGKSLTLIIFITLFLGYLLYVNFFLSFFGYFTNPTWVRQTRINDAIQISHSPLKWGWGPARHDNIPHHRSSTVFWFRNDNPFAQAMFLFHLFLFLTLFFVYLYWITLLRRVYVFSEINYTLLTYCVSILRQFLLFFLLLYVLVFISYVTGLWRFPIEYYWVINAESWFVIFARTCADYALFLIHIISG